MIKVDGPPDEWAGDVARLMVERGAQPADLHRFYETAFTMPPSDSRWCERCSAIGCPHTRPT